MKPEKIITEIVKNSQYDRLVKLWSLENGNGEHLPSEKIIKVLQALSKRIDNKKKSFLCSLGLKPHLDSNTISFKVPQYIQTAKDEFDRELNEQMPVFIQLMNKIPAENLMRESIAV